MSHVGDHSSPESTSPEGSEYERRQQRLSLYRVLAHNMIRELRDAGYCGNELIGFAGEVMQAIVDNGWAQEGDDDVPSSPHPPSKASVSDKAPGPERADSWMTIDSNGMPVLTGQRVHLRPPTGSDETVLRKWSEDPAVRASLIPPVLQFVLEHLDAPKSPDDRVDLVVCDRASMAAVGLVSLHDMDWTTRQAALGKMIGEPAFRGKGIAQEATRLIVTYGFDARGLNRIYLRTLGGNLKNIRLNERMGFRFEGVLQRAAISEGRPADVVLMAMLRSESWEHTDG